MKYKIAPDFENLMPPHSAEEIAAMEQGIIANPDAFPPVVVWSNHHNTVIEGHLRLKLFRKHGLTPKFIKMEFPDRGSAMAHAVVCQAGRRNMNAGQVAVLLTKYPIPKKAATHPNTPKVGDNTSPSNRELANLAGTTTRTIQRAKQLRREAAPEVVEQVERGAKTLDKAIAETKTPAKKERPELVAFKKIDAALGKMIRDASDINKDLAPSKHFEEFKQGLDVACKALSKWRSHAR